MHGIALLPQNVKELDKSRINSFRLKPSGIPPSMHSVMLSLRESYRPSGHHSQARLHPWWTPSLHGICSHVLLPHEGHLFQGHLLNTLWHQLSFLVGSMFQRHLELIVKWDAALSSIHLCCPLSCLLLVAKEISVKWGPCPKGLIILRCSLPTEVMICCVWNHV